jgi:hypothetical protein
MPRARLTPHTPVDDSFTWMVNFLDRGLHTITRDLRVEH